MTCLLITQSEGELGLMPNIIGLWITLAMLFVLVLVSSLIFTGQALRQ